MWEEEAHRGCFHVSTLPLATPRILILTHPPSVLSSLSHARVDCNCAALLCTLQTTYLLKLPLCYAYLICFDHAMGKRPQPSLLIACFAIRLRVHCNCAAMRAHCRPTSIAALRTSATASVQVRQSVRLFSHFAVHLNDDGLKRGGSSVRLRCCDFDFEVLLFLRDAV